MNRQRARWIAALSASAVTALALTSCASSGGNQSQGNTTLTLATVNNPQMKDMEQLKGEFEKSHPGIKVKFVQMAENDLRESVTKDIATGGGQYDIVTIGSFEVPIWANNHWIAELDPLIKNTPDWDESDLLPSVRDGITVDKKLYAAPFYGESSMLMYNKKLVEQAGITIPDHPTWDQIEQAAAKLKTADTAGICLRGKPGWGEFGGPLTSMIYTSGSSWYDKNWKAQLNTPKFADAVDRYMRILKQSGEGDPASFGFTECLNLFSQGKAAMWVDATVAAGTLESKDASAVAGNVGYAHSPVIDSKESGWLWSWNLAIPQSSKKQQAAWQFISWATSKKYIDLVGNKLGWERVPPGSRTSTYENPNYLKSAASFAPITLDVMKSINASQFGPMPQPYKGYYPATPDWPNLGDQVTQDLADVMAGRASVKDVLAKDQKLAQTVGDNAKKNSGN